MAGQISMGARREITATVSERYRASDREEKGRILDELCKVTGWHRKHAIRKLLTVKRLAGRQTEDKTGRDGASRRTVRRRRMLS